MLLNVLLILPIALNAYILYWLGNHMTGKSAG